MNCKYCLDDLNFSVKVVDIATKCKYHKKTEVVYSPSAVAPGGLCRELFYAAYPACLSLLYSGKPIRGWLRKKGIKKIASSCPAANGIKVAIKAEEIFIPPLRMLKEFIEEVCKIVLRPLDGPFRRVVIEVIEAGSDCPKGYRVGDKFYFNIDKQDELCPASFSAIYPYLRLLKGKNKNEGLLSSKINVHCPDWVGVTYELEVK